MERGEVDTVLLALTDMQGRLQGKRLTARHFLARSLEHGAEGCNYLLAVDVDMATVERLRDVLLGARLRRLRDAPGPRHAAAGAVAGGDRRCASPTSPGRTAPTWWPRRARSCARQLARLAERGWSACAGTELEFIVFRDTYEQAWQKGYRDLEPANLYNVDYSLLGTARVEPLIRRIRNSMEAAGMLCEDSKGECNYGQHEINFRYADALRTADEHSIYKNGAKEIAAQEGMSITFMAKYDEREGNSCHIHFSLRRRAGRRCSSATAALFESFLAGQLAGAARADAAARARTSTPTSASPPASSRRRPWRGGHDNRTCSLRVVGEGPSLRFENRVGGADLNPYLALSAIIAAGLHGVERGLELEPVFEGNAYAATDRPQVPGRAARRARAVRRQRDRARGASARRSSSTTVNAADVELEAFGAAVTDWERYRGFERL